MVLFKQVVIKQIVHGGHMNSNKLIPLAQKAFVAAVVYAVGVVINQDDVCIEVGVVSLDCVWKNLLGEFVHGKCFYSEEKNVGPTDCSASDCATIVISEMALVENGKPHLQFPLQNYYVRALHSENPQVVGAR